jgi:hypothetical protein
MTHLPESDCRRFQQDLHRVERELDHGPSSESALAALDALLGHLGICAACEAHHASRVRALEGRVALRERALPDGALDGLYEAVREHTLGDWGHGGGFSDAFLDAPRSLRMWRSVAVAAALLVAFGAGLFVTGRLRLIPDHTGVERRLEDARPDLLWQVGAPPPDSAGTTDTMPIYWYAPRQDGFFAPRAPRRPDDSRKVTEPTWN